MEHPMYSEIMAKFIVVLLSVSIFPSLIWPRIKLLNEPHLELVTVLYNPPEQVEFQSCMTEDFALRMLKKLGWTEGKGLGKEENGRVKPVQVEQKQNQKGIGFGTEGLFKPWWDDLYNKTALSTAVKSKAKKKEKEEKERKRKDRKNSKDDKVKRKDRKKSKDDKVSKKKKEKKDKKK